MTQEAVALEAEDPTKSKLRLWLKLLKVTRQIEGEMREKLRAEFGSTLPRFDVMAALHRFPKGLRMSELSGVLKVSNGNVTGIIDRLVADGLVVRCPVPDDRRALMVRLTGQGSDEFLRQAAKHEQWIDEILVELSPNDAEALAADLDRVGQHFDHRGVKS